MTDQMLQTNFDEIEELVDRNRLDEAIALAESRLQDLTQIGAAHGGGYVHLEQRLREMRLLTEPKFRATKSRQTRHVLVRYPQVLRPETTTPLFVIVSELGVKTLDAKTIAEVRTSPVDADAEVALEIQPILPGCECYPKANSVTAEDRLAIVRFDVVAKNAGIVSGARVLIRQGNRVLGEAPLKLTVRRSGSMVLTAIAFALLTTVLPLLLKFLNLDADGQARQDFALWRAVLQSLFDIFETVPWWAIGALSACCLAFLWWMLRPRADESSRMVEVDLEAGEPRPVLEEASDVAAPSDWLAEASARFEMKDFAAAYSYYEWVFAEDTPPPLDCAKAAVCASLGGVTARALEWVDAGLAQPMEKALRGKMLYNRACYLVRLARFEEAEQSLREGSRSPGVDPARYQSDPDLAPLRQRNSFRAWMETQQS